MRKMFALVAVLAATSSLYAAPIAGNGNLGDFTGTFTYTPLTSTTGQLTVSLTNAATTLPGGKITGFAFNLPTGVTVSSYVGSNTFSLLGGGTFNNTVDVNPYGNADTGAALGGNWLGGGSPNPGVAVGQTGNWTFNLTGTGMLGLNDASFYNLLTTGGGQGSANFLVRFRGFDNGGSDKVPGGSLGNPNPPDDPNGSFEVPEPATMVTLGLLGAMGLVGYRLRKKKA